MELNEKQKKLLGSFLHETADNSDAFMKKIGISFFLRQIAKIQKPLFKLTYNVETQTWHVSD